MNRVLSISLTGWSMDMAKRRAGGAAPADDVPFVLIGRDGSRRFVHACNPAAQAAGLRPGTPVTKAQALVQGLVFQDVDLAADARDLEQLAIWFLQRIAPIVDVDGSDGIAIDTTGTERLHGGEAGLIEDMVSKLAAKGIQARAAVADTLGVAHALARFSRSATVIAPRGHGAGILSAYPLECLRLPANLASQLRVLGFERVRDLLEQPRAPLALRFGNDLTRRLDQISGDLVEPIAGVKPHDLIEVQRAFAEPIGAAETIAKYIDKLVAQIVTILEARGVGARRLDLICTRVDSAVQAVSVGLATPVRDPKRLGRLLRDKIGEIDPGWGLERMVVAAPVVEPIERRQMASSLIEEATPDVSDLVDTLVNRVGSGAVYRMTPVESDVPERSVARIPALSPETGSDWPDHWPRPARLLQRPEQVDVMALLPDHPPAHFVWRGVRRRVQRADGPERVFGEWWKRDSELAAVRDYFRVEDTSGERYWIFRAGDGVDPETGSHRWFMHGIFG
jgi:protein ImuB